MCVCVCVSTVFSIFHIIYSYTRNTRNIKYISKLANSKSNQNPIMCN